MEEISRVMMNSELDAMAQGKNSRRQRMQHERKKDLGKAKGEDTFSNIKRLF